ncbi:MAG: site-2 protease family protein [Patescibacteria group bacterium]
MGLLSLLSTSPIIFFMVALVLVIAIAVHEFAHAWMADRLGDPTPRHQGRVTLNPLAHLDPLGTMAILLVGFGWGRPVMFDPYNLKNPIKDAALIAFAGPASNLLLALALAIGAPLLGGVLPLAGSDLVQFSQLAIFFNIMLAIFNLIPIHPLDGGKIAVALLPKNLALEYDDFMQRYGIFVLLMLIFPFGGQSAVASLILPIINTVVQIYLTLSANILQLL